MVTFSWIPFIISKKTNKKTVFYLPEILRELYKCTGNVIYALCSGGAAFVHRSSGAALYSEMLNRVPCNLDFIILLSFGNDWYSHRVRPLTQPTRVAAEQCCLRMKALAKRQFAVIGGSSKTWNYHSWMQPNSANQFDANAETLVSLFRNMGICSLTGADELENSTLADSIGHVLANDTNRRAVFDAYHTWLTMCTWECKSSLHQDDVEASSATEPPALPPPPPPPPARFPEPWSAVYCDAYNTYYYFCSRR